MKKVLLFIVIIACSLVGRTQGTQVAVPSGELLTLKETSYDFGKIQQGRPVTHEFELINTGTDTLKLENVQASCGCTTPVWKKAPIAPHATGKIQVGFNAANQGPFEKTVNIFYNGNKVKSVIIKGQVYKAPACSAPANTSIELLKESN